MKKTMIALAVAAAMPVAAQADVTLSGYVEATYASSNYSMETDLDFAVTEVLTNGMTASAGFDVDSNTNGSASLSGDFGTVAFSSAMDVKTGVAAADVAGMLGDFDEHDDADDEASGNGVSYTGSFAGLTIAASSTSDSDYQVAAGNGINAAGVSYDMNGVTIAAGQIKEEGQSSESVIGASYSFGDLTVAGGSHNKTDGTTATTLSATYTMTLDALSVVGTVEDVDGEGDWDVTATYTLSGVALTAKTGKGDDTELEASYTSGAVSVSWDEGDEEVVVGYNMGNAAISLTRDTAADSTELTYKVSF